MARGEAWVWSPEIGHFARAKAPPIRTYDSMQPAKSGAAAVKGWASVDLETVRGRLADVVKEAEANDPARLKKRIAELEKLLEKSNREGAKGAKVVAEVQVKEVPVIKPAEVKRLEGLAGRFDAAVVAMRDQTAVLRDAVKRWGGNGKPADRGVSRENNLSRLTQAASSKPVAKATSQTDGDYSQNNPASAERALGKAERAILQALYWLRGESAKPAKVGFYARYRAGSGTFNNAMGRLRSLGLVAGWQITAAGEETAFEYGVSAKPTGRELHDWLGAKLGKAENALLDVLIGAYPNRLADAELGEAAGYTPGSGTFNNALGRLRTLEAAEGYARDGGAMASGVFFE
jgi:hypothetical protein